MTDILENLFFCDSEMWVIIFWVRTRMDDAIHVQIQVVKFWKLKKTMKKTKQTVKSFIAHS